MRLWWCVLLGMSLAAVLANSPSAAARTVQSASPSKLPVTTSSAVARQQFEKGMRNLEYLRRPEALDNLRAAVKADPNFAQAIILISHLSNDPAEQQAMRVRAEQNAKRVTPAERLLIRWLAGVQEDNFVPAIAAMNDLLAKYPSDQRLAFLAGRWLVLRDQFAQSAVILERAVALNPDYPAALNELGYAYAFSGNSEKGFAAMDRYVALEPDQPNPHDSYGEILRLAGKFDAAIEEFRASIRIDPNFGSELGVADTYAVMGKEQEARDEYERAVIFATSESDRVQYELQSAVTWIRENNRKQAERALREVARHAHASGLGQQEAEANRVLALYEPDYKAARKYLQAAQNAIDERHPLTASDREEEHARILRARALRAAEAREPEAEATAVQQLEDMAKDSRSESVQHSWHAAAGAVLLAQAKYEDAISHLEEDSADPLTLRLLWQAYNGKGDKAEAQAIVERLSNLNTPTVEQALVVPQFRASLVGQAKQP